MLTLSFDNITFMNKTSFIVANDKGRVHLVDFDIKNNQSDENNKFEIVKKIWEVEDNQKILEVQISPFFSNIFAVLTSLSFYIFDIDFNDPFFISPISTNPHSCLRWSNSRYY